MDHAMTLPYHFDRYHDPYSILIPKMCTTLLRPSMDPTPPSLKPSLDPIPTPTLVESIASFNPITLAIEPYPISPLDPYSLGDVLLLFP